MGLFEGRDLKFGCRNSPTHSALASCTQNDMTILPYPPYFPDLVQSSYSFSKDDMLPINSWNILIGSRTL